MKLLLPVSFLIMAMPSSASVAENASWARALPPGVWAQAPVGSFPGRASCTIELCQLGLNADPYFFGVRVIMLDGKRVVTVVGSAAPCGATTVNDYREAPTTPSELSKMVMETIGSMVTPLRSACQLASEPAIPDIDAGQLLFVSEN